MHQLGQRAVEFEDYEMTENGLATWETAKAAWFRHPDGNNPRTQRNAVIANHSQGWDLTFDPGRGFTVGS